MGPCLLHQQACSPVLVAAPRVGSWKIVRVCVRARALVPRLAFARFRCRSCFAPAQLAIWR
eukprot:1369127-Alexandrium_andersonii.AAC.1